MIDAVNLDDLEGVSFDPEVLSRKGCHVDDAEEIGLARLNGDLQVLGIVHESGLRDWLGEQGWRRNDGREAYQVRHRWDW